MIIIIPEIIIINEKPTQESAKTSHLVLAACEQRESLCSRDASGLLLTVPLQPRDEQDGTNPR